jgi:hypothetical protein
MPEISPNTGQKSWIGLHFAEKMDAQADTLSVLEAILTFFAITLIFEDKTLTIMMNTNLKTSHIEVFEANNEIIGPIF